MRYMELLIALAFAVCMSACNNSSDPNTTSENANDSAVISDDIQEENDIPFDDFSDDEILLMSPAYAPQLLKPSQATVQSLLNTLKSSSWETTEFDTSISDGENYSVFVYNEGQPFRLIFYGDLIVDYEQNDKVSRYKISEEAFKEVFDAVHPENVSDYLVDCDIENISVEGVWKDKNNTTVNSN